MVEKSAFEIGWILCFALESIDQSFLGKEPSLTLKNKKIAVIVPAYNEQKLIGQVIESMPGYVDAIYVVDDAGNPVKYYANDKYEVFNSKDTTWIDLFNRAGGLTWK